MPAEVHQLAFVDSIAVNPGLRLNLHNDVGGPWNLRDSSRFDPPPLKRAIPASLLADGGTPAGAVYDNRTIVLELQLLGPSGFLDADSAAAQLQLLMRELDRPFNLLRYQPGVAAPVFFRTYRSGPDAVEYSPVNRSVSVSLLAEPFAYGLEETLSPVTVTNNPAAGSNGMFMDITAPKGDVETPLTLTLSGTIGVTGQKVTAIGVRRRGTPANAPLFLQAEAMTQGLDTTTQANSASFSGAGNNYSRCTFATNPNGNQRLSVTAWPSGSSVDYRGTYRVLVRLRQNTGTDSIDVQLQWGASSSSFIWNDLVHVPGGNTNIKYVDVGLVQFPAGYDPVYDGVSGVELPVLGQFVGLFARRTSGTGSLDIDFLLFLPADDRLEFVKWPASQTGGDVFVADGGPRPAAYCLDSSGNLRTTQPIEIAGTGVMISPGRTNRVVVAQDVGTGTAATGSGDSVSNTVTVTPSYFPRYLFPLRPAAS